MTNKLLDALAQAKTVAITGHVNPDGDCVGSCMGMYLYLKENYPGIRADVYLKDVMESFSYIEDLDKARERFELGDKYDPAASLRCEQQGSDLCFSGNPAFLCPVCVRGSPCDQSGAGGGKCDRA